MTAKTIEVTPRLLEALEEFRRTSAALTPDGFLERPVGEAEAILAAYNHATMTVCVVLDEAVTWPDRLERYMADAGQLLAKTCPPDCDHKWNPACALSCYED